MNWRKWLDEFVLAGKGILLATKEKRFWVGFIISFLFFGLLMNLLLDGTADFTLIFKSKFPDNLKVLGENFLAIFGFNHFFHNWLPIFIISLLQGILIGLIALLWKKKRKQKSGDVEQASIIAGLIAIGAGCPACGTALITPLLATVFSSSSVAIAGTVSIVATWLVVILAIFAIKRLGLEAYATIINEKYLEKKESREKNK